MNTINTTSEPATHYPDHRAVYRLIARRSYGILSTVSSNGNPHAAGVVYELVGNDLYVNTRRTSRKARNIAHQSKVAMVVPIRRVPVGGPPSAVQFQSTAHLLRPQDSGIMELLAEGHLKSITSHGELDLPDTCFVRIGLPSRLHTYGLGMPLLELIRHPLDGAGLVEGALADA